jgi:hypothetical protein
MNQEAASSKEGAAFVCGCCDNDRFDPMMRLERSGSAVVGPAREVRVERNVA